MTAQDTFMRKLNLMAVAAGLMLMLAGCGSPTPAAPISTSTPQPPAEPTAFTSGCVNTRQENASPTQRSLFDPVSGQDHALGQQDAAATVIMYGDFQCEGCAQIARALQDVQQRYPAELRIVFRHYPLVYTHDKAALAVQASEAAALQGKFWEMHNLLYDRLAEWNELSLEAFRAWLLEQSAGLGLEATRFASDLASDPVTAIPLAAWENGKKIGIPGAPLLLINGEILRPPYVLEQVEPLIHMYALPARQFKNCPTTEIDPGGSYYATLKTSKGEVVIQLFADKTPITVNNFVFLARNGWFENVPFHRVLPGFVAQTGDPSGTGLGNPGYFIPDEINPGLNFDRAGMVGMVNSGPDTNGSQFFITYSAAEQLNGQYTVFGEVVSGMDVLLQLTARDPGQGALQPEPDLLLSVTIEER